ncbi:MAG: hypothetical protein KKB29_00055 [Nanoarchaeota archaeon]|nr:hypothetical protein [Nanoarchaeota archaeon]
MNNVSVPIKTIDGENWLSLMNLTSKAKVRSIGMDGKSKRIQDKGKHHCFEINVEGNIRIRPKSWKIL